MRWYRVVKTVKGHRYLYDQRSWREGKKVRTQSRYIGPAGADTSVRSESQPRSLIASDTKQGDFEAELSGIKELYRGVNEGTTTKLHLNKLGRGLYTTTNLKSAQRYVGETGQVLKMNPATAMPQNPIRFKDDWEFFNYRDALWEKYGIVGIETLIQKEGYDGVVVGRNGNFYIVKYEGSSIETSSPPIASDKKQKGQSDTRSISQKVADKVKERAMSGGLENRRLQSNDIVSVYRAGKHEVRPGDFVSLNREEAESYLLKRPGTQLYEAKVKASDLTEGGGQGSSYIYVPHVGHQP